MHPDGDAIGSMIGLGLALRDMGKNVAVIASQPLLPSYHFLPGSEMVSTPEGVHGKRFDCGIVLDCTSLDRLPEEVGKLFDQCETLINIDHHVSNAFFGAVNIVDSSASATAEILYQVLSALEIGISPDVATNLYTALVTDTGSFRYQNTTHRCHLVASLLLEHGADHNKVQQRLNEQRTLASIRLLQKGLSTLVLDREGQIAWMTISRLFCLETGCQMEESEDYINYPKSIAGVEIAILFKEIDDHEVRVGFRSKNFADVDALAGRFGGGGHIRAAGCTVKGTLQEVEALVIDAARGYLQKKREVS
ncbi:MAG: bifunctional oligoribonuclease/PAP phosphatase NrnA [Thermacetogeniaceae bacterium]